MKKISPVFLSIVLMIILNSCSKDNFTVAAEEITLHNERFPVSFVKETKVTVEALTKGYPHFVRIQGEDHLFIKFRNGENNHEIWRYNRETLEFQKKFIVNRGQGPGEAMKAHILGGTTDKIVMYDSSCRRLIFWDSNFKNYIMKKHALITHLFPPISSYGYSPKSGYALIWEIVDESPNVKMKHNVYLKKIDQEKDGPDERKIYVSEFSAWRQDSSGELQLWPSARFHAVMLNDLVFLANLQAYEIYTYNLTGELLKKVKIKFQHKNFSNGQLDEWKKSFGVKSPDIHFPDELYPACWLIPLGKGFVVGRREDYLSSEQEWIPADYFDMSLRYLGKIKLPWFKSWNHPFYCQTNADLFTLGKNEYLYIVKEAADESDNFVLSRWRMRDEK